MTRMQDTSLSVYFREVLPDINEKQLAILRLFQETPTMNFTNWEIHDELGWEINSVTPRVYELRGLDKRFPLVRPILIFSERRANRIKRRSPDDMRRQKSKSTRTAMAWMINPEVRPGGYKIS